MKKIISVLIAFLCTLSLCSCGETDPEKAFENLRDYVSNYFENDNYYIQISKTQAQAQTVTEVSKYGDDTCFLTYDVTGALQYYRNGKEQNVSAGSYYAPEEKDAKWEDYSYKDTAEKYLSALKEICKFDYKNKEKLAFSKVEKAQTEGSRFPYKVTVSLNIDKMNIKGLFNSGANFGSLTVKFLTNDEGTVFDNITISAQYDYNSEITVMAAQFGDPKSPDENSSNGQRPEDIEEVYKRYLEKMQKDYQSYLESIQKSMQLQEGRSTSDE